MLKDQLLNIFNGIAIIAILFVAIFTWVYMNAQLMWGVLLIMLILLLVLYANTRKRIIQYIEERRKTLNRPVDIKAEQRLNIINGIAIIAILLVAVVAWIYMSEQFMWGVILIMLILLLVGVINVRKLIADIG